MASGWISFTGRSEPRLEQHRSVRRRDGRLHLRGVECCASHRRTVSPRVVRHGVHPASRTVSLMSSATRSDARHTRSPYAPHLLEPAAGDQLGQRAGARLRARTFATAHSAGAPP